MTRSSQRRGEKGQVIVIFALALVGIVAMVGLVLDGGSAFEQRREEQNVSDLAAMAGATAYINTTGDVAAKTAAADAAARYVATANGYTAGANSVVVNVATTGYATGATVRVSIKKAHANTFSGVVGMPTWDVATTAQAEVNERANGINGAMPLLFNSEAFPTALCDESSGTCVPEVYQLPGTGNEDVPQDATQFNWTIFCQANGNPCNANSDGVRDLIEQEGEEDTVWIGDDIGPLNAGSHTTLFDAIGAHVGGIFPVPIVNDDGEMVGFAYFKLISVEGGSNKVIRGYFVSPVRGAELVFNQDHDEATLATGGILLELID